MIERLFVGRYEKEDVGRVLTDFGYSSAITFDGRECRKCKAPFELSESDNLIYHLAGFLTVLDKRISRTDERPIVLYNVTEYLDEATSLDGYLSKLKKYGRDIFIFSSRNKLQQDLILSVRLVDFSKYEE